MRAVAVTALGGPEVLQMVELPDPVAGPGEVLVRIQAVCVQPADRGVHQHVVLIDPVRERLKSLVDDAAAGLLLTRVATQMPLADAAEAHRLVEAGGLRGKILLIP